MVNEFGYDRLCVSDHMRIAWSCRTKLDDQEECEKWQQQLIQATKPPDMISNLFAFKHCAYCKDKGIHYQHGNSFTVYTLYGSTLS